MRFALLLLGLVACDSLRNAGTTADAGTPTTTGDSGAPIVKDGGTIASNPDGGSGSCTTCARTITSGRTNVQFLVVDENHIYFNDGHSIIECARDNCDTPLTLGTNATVTGLVVTKDTVFWSDEQGDSISSCPIAGCAQPTLLVSNQNSARGLTFDAKNLYWIAADAIESCPIDLCGNDTLHDLGITGVESTALAASFDSLSWATPEKVLEVFLGGQGPLETTTDSSIGGTDFSADSQSGNTYWVDNNNIIRGCRLGGCANTPDQLATTAKPATPVGFTTQFSWRDLNDKKIYTCARDSCSTPTVFASSQSFGDLGQIVVPDEDWVYWTVADGVMRAHR